MSQERSGAGIGPARDRQEPGRTEVTGRIAQYFQLSILLAILTAIVVYHYSVRGFHRYPVWEQASAPAANPDQGRQLLRSYGCIGCHEVPGVPGATGRVGPRLDRLNEQSFIAGILPNSPQNLAEWIRRPREIDPHTAMPNLEVGEQDARDLAAFLLTR